MKKIVARLLVNIGKRYNLSDDEIDKLQTFSDTDQMPFDQLYFNTSSADKQVLMFSTARRESGMVEASGFLRVPEFSEKLLVIPIYPNATLHQNEIERECMDCYSIAGITLTPVVPMKEYRIEYTGKMRFDDISRQNVDVELNATWRSDLPMFNFLTDISNDAISKAMSLEKWNKTYFNNLESHSQPHYEQYGRVDGCVKIDGKEYQIETSGIRRRTIDKNFNWSDNRRYMLHYIRLENGDAISVGVISMPIVFSRLVIGFVTKAKEKINVPIDSCSIQLDEFGEQPPDQYSFKFNTRDNSYSLVVSRHKAAEVSLDGCRFVYTWCDFKVNGIKGFGAVEWEYGDKK